MSKDETGCVDFGVTPCFLLSSSLYSHVGCSNVHGHYHVFLVFVFFNLHLGNGLRG